MGPDVQHGGGHHDQPLSRPPDLPCDRAACSIAARIGAGVVVERVDPGAFESEAAHPARARFLNPGRAA